MAVRGYFYNSVNFDRPYNGEDMNEDKAPFYKEGVVYGHMEVKAGEGMTVTVDGGTKTGYAYINMHTIHNTTVLPLTVSQASGTLPRIDRVILRNDQTERKPSIFILEGAYSSNPQPPALTNNDVIQEKCLAEITVNAGAVEITDADIRDTRDDPELCGFVASQFAEFDFSQLTRQFDSWFAQEKSSMQKDHADFIEMYAELTKAFMNDQQKEWDKWFEEKQSQLDKDVAGKLQLQIDKIKKQVQGVALKIYIAYALENIQAAVLVTLKNNTTGEIQTAEVSESGMGFYITDKGEYTLETNMESVMVTPKAFSVDHTELMEQITATLREGTNLAYIGNYLGTYLLQ